MSGHDVYVVYIDKPPSYFYSVFVLAVKHFSPVRTEHQLN